MIPRPGQASGSMWEHSRKCRFLGLAPDFDSVGLEQSLGICYSSTYIWIQTMMNLIKVTDLPNLEVTMELKVDRGCVSSWRLSPALKTTLSPLVKSFIASCSSAL